MQVGPPGLQRRLECKCLPSWRLQVTRHYQGQGYGAQLGDGSRGRALPAAPGPATLPCQCPHLAPCAQTPAGSCPGPPQRKGHSPCVLWSHHIPRRQEPTDAKCPIYPHLVSHLQASRHLNSLSELAFRAPTASFPICPLAGRPRLLRDAA